MKLLMAPLSPYVRKVRVLLRETGQLGAVEEVEISTTPLASNADVVAANPTGRIPVLLRDEGPAIYDSRVITRYLDDRFKAGLYPADRLWEVLTVEATADGILDSALIMTYEGRFKTPEQQSPAWMDAQWEKISRAVAALDGQWMDELVEPVHMGQIAVGCALGYLDLRHDARNWRVRNHRLAAWYAGFSDRPSMKMTAPVV
jgi:glutathione S-transferase